MGVMNLTPDSFSDGDPNLNINKLDSFFHSENIDIYDLGAHSTAPFNSHISIEEELKRFEKSVKKIDQENLMNKICSLDTYRIDVYDSLIRHFNILPIFNDVSGCIDDQLIEYLKSNPDITYIYSHNFVKDRVDTIHHMDYCIESHDIVSDIADYFFSGLSILKKNNIKNKIILDPCFGFSKSFEQNISLAHNLQSLCELFPANYDWVIGVSKKSFLRKIMNDLKWTDPFKASEYLHRSLLLNFSKINRNLIFRVHHSSIAANLF